MSIRSARLQEIQQELLKESNNDGQAFGHLFCLPAGDDTHYWYARITLSKSQYTCLWPDADIDKAKVQLGIEQFIESHGELPLTFDEQPPRPTQHYLNLESFKTYLANRGIRSLAEFQKVAAPAFVPTDPLTHYGVTESSLFHRPKARFLSFDDAVNLARQLDCSRYTDYKKMCERGERPPELPADPVTYYGYNWRGWDYFLNSQS